MTGHSIRSSFSLFFFFPFSPLQLLVTQVTTHRTGREIATAHCPFPIHECCLPPVDRNASSMRLYFDPRPGSGFSFFFFPVPPVIGQAWFHQLPLNSWDRSTYAWTKEWMVVTLILLGHESSLPSCPTGLLFSLVSVSQLLLFVSLTSNERRGGGQGTTTQVT